MYNEENMSKGRVQRNEVPLKVPFTSRFFFYLNLKVLGFTFKGKWFYLTQNLSYWITDEEPEVQTGHVVFHHCHTAKLVTELG